MATLAFGGPIEETVVMEENRDRLTLVDRTHATPTSAAIVMIDGRA